VNQPACVRVSQTSLADASAELGAELPTWLSDPEQSRYVTMTAPRRKAQFVAGRWWARQCLASAFGGDWQDYVLSAPEGAAPTVQQAPPHAVAAQGIHLSLSHSADWLVCAVALHPVGVDVEDSTRQRDVDALGEQIYGRDERLLIQAMSAQERRHNFFALWTLKEAWIKQMPGRADMRAVQFLPGGLEPAQAVVLRAAAFTVAVVSTELSNLNLYGPELSCLQIDSWCIVGAEGV
jgi:phosphopantetheinyl transferase